MILSDLTKFKRDVVKLVVLVSIIGLAACGGGGGGSKPGPIPTIAPTLAPTPEPDTTPNTFSFSLSAEPAAPGAEIETTAITISGLNTAAPITISNGEYSIEGGAYTSVAGTINNNQLLSVRASAGQGFGEAVTVTITIGDVSSSFSITTVVEDTTPEAFSFASESAVTRGEQRTSSTVAITGINTLTPISISGGEYTINEGDYVTEAGTLSPNDTVTVRLLASSDFSTTTQAALTIGGVQGSFSVTTEARDIEPDAFSFTAVNAVAPSSEQTAGPITVSGINDTTTISISGGDYALNGGAYTREAGTVVLGDSVSVKATAAATPSSDVDVVLTVGTVTGTFSINTLDDTTAPTAAIAFPPPMSKTPTASVMVRGTAVDDYSSVASVKILVNDVDSGLTVDSSDNLATWRVELPLVDGENRVRVVVTDSLGNENTSADTVTVMQGSVTEAFPHEGVALSWRNTSILVTGSENAYKVLTFRDVTSQALVSMDLNTGIRTETILDLPDSVPANVSSPGGTTYGSNMVLDEDTNTLYLAIQSYADTGVVIALDADDYTVKNSLVIPADAGGIYMTGLTIDRSQDTPRLLFSTELDSFIGQIDMGLTAVTPFSTDELPNDQNPLEGVCDMAIHPITGEIYVFNRDDNDTVLRINSSTGAREVVSSDVNAVGDAISWNGCSQLAFDINGGSEKLFVGDSESVFLSVDVETGVQAIFGFDDPEINIPTEVIQTHRHLGYILGLSLNVSALYAIDLVSGQKVLISRS